jgi:hypothetical protein
MALLRSIDPTRGDLMLVYFVMTDRNGLIRLIPRNAVWAEVGLYKGDCSQVVLDYLRALPVLPHR